MIVKYRDGRMEGPIRLNERFIWEPNTQLAREVRVMRLSEVHGVLYIHYLDSVRGDSYATEEEFRAACIRAMWR